MQMKEEGNNRLPQDMKDDILLR